MRTPEAGDRVGLPIVPSKKRQPKAGQSQFRCDLSGSDPLSSAALGLHDNRGHLINPDGKFGPATKAAVEAFQHNHNLADDGIAGPNTEKALQHATLQQSALTAITLDHPQHPGHLIFQQALAGVGQLDRAQGRAMDMSSYVAMGKATRGVELASVDDIDEDQLVSWMRQITAKPGVGKRPAKK